MGSQAGWHLSDNLYLEPITKLATLATYERHLANQNTPYESCYTTAYICNGEGSLLGLRHVSLPRSRFLDVTLRDIQKTAARETIVTWERNA